MSNNIPENLKYTKTHEWARLDSDGTITLGITDHAQESLGDMVFVELPQTGATITAGKECGVIESVKSASDLYAPISGEVIVANDKVTTTPALLNSDPQGEGWLLKVRPSNKSELDALMDAKTYSDFVASSEH